MRVSASLGLVVILASLAACEQRNFTHCLTNDSNFACDAGKFCKPNETDPMGGVGTCEDSQCAIGESQSRCTAAAPICTTQGRCVGCTNSIQCAALGSAQPVCLIENGKTEGTCVACGVDKDCNPTPDTLPLKAAPACDKTSHTCRACVLHSECPNQVCAKDDTLKSLPNPIALGTCPSKDRIIVVDTSGCGMGTCPMQTQVSAMSANMPYVLVKEYQASKGGSITIGTVSGLPEQHIISVTGDFSPATIPATQTDPQPKPKAELKGNGAPAIQVNAGASVTLEGFYIHDSGMPPAILCNSLGTTATSIKLLRSIVSRSDLAIKTNAMCSLIVDQSWIGTPPGEGISGNTNAMNLDSTNFQITNSVFDHNYGTGNVFGGITLIDTGKPGNLKGSIVNSTFYRHDSLGAIPAMAVYCPAALTTVTIFNTLFVNSPGFNLTNPAKPYVDPRCYTAPGALGYYATDEKPAPLSTTVITGVSDNIFTSTATALLSLLPTALPKALITGGAKTFNDIASPTVDVEGKPRGTTSVTLGAFEVAH